MKLKSSPRKKPRSGKSRPKVLSHTIVLAVLDPGEKLL